MTIGSDKYLYIQERRNEQPRSWKSRWVIGAIAASTGIFLAWSFMLLTLPVSLG